MYIRRPSKRQRTTIYRAYRRYVQNGIPRRDALTLAYGDSDFEWPPPYHLDPDAHVLHPGYKTATDIEARNLQWHCIRCKWEYPVATEYDPDDGTPIPPLVYGCPGPRILSNERANARA